MPVKKKTEKTNNRSVAKRRTVKKPTMRPVVTAPVPKKPEMVGPLHAIGRFWTRYFDFMGRSTRFEFWFGFVFAFLLDWVCMRYIGGIFSNIVSIVVFIPMMALCVRRFRDAGLSVWWYLLPALFVYLIPIIRSAAWYRMLSFGYVSSGMIIYAIFFLLFGVFELVVGCLPSRK